ncbi:Voltage-dependent T-type calcium channel subunit alpha-1H [Bagarius yarrelli]|uniref:Voltage-dependent T-type calcium channel subunit alpha-1H n=1 Tax=Bagarius yarrelli TaxID=175774 RepID=A0A556TTH5_BAGYA|nr:Voltage-dependent T-type calcium channel subunit alpha-1H [Bagarius yarrelli]
MTEEEQPAAVGVSSEGADSSSQTVPSPGWEAAIDEEVRHPEQEEVGSAVQEVEEEACSELSAVVVPYPELASVVFFCLKQTTCPRSWCIRLVASPYPLLHVHAHTNIQWPVI